MTLEELRVVITSQTQGLNRGIADSMSQLTSLERHSTSVANNIGKAFKTAFSVIGVTVLARGIQQVTQDAIKMNAMMGNLGMTMGDNNLEFIKWAQGSKDASDKSATDWGLSTAAAIKYGAAYSSIIAGFISDYSAITEKTKELLTVTTIVASKTGRSVEDVADRIRSGLLGSTEAIEDLGIQVKVSVLETLDVFKELANGKTWAQLDANTQQQILLLGILEQANKRFGTTLGDTTATRLMVLQANLQNVTTQIGQAFIPVVEAAIPSLMNLALWLQRVAMYFTAFMELLFNYKPKPIEIGKVSNNATKQLGGVSSALGGVKTAAEEAAAATSKSLAGFDQLNVLPENTSAGASETAGGGGVSGGYDLASMFGGEAMTQQFEDFDKNMADVRKKMEDLMPIIKAVTAALVIAFAISKISGFIIGLAAVQRGLRTLGFMKAFSGITGILAGLGRLILSPFKLLWAFLLANPVVAAIAAIVGIFAILYTKCEWFRDGVNAVIDNIKTKAAEFGQAFMDALPIIAGFFSEVVDRAGQFLSDLLAPFMPFLADIWKAITTFIGTVVTAIGTFFTSIITAMKDYMKNSDSTLLGFLGAVIKAIGTFIYTVFTSFVTFFMDILNAQIKWIADMLSGFVSFITETVKSIGAFISDVTKSIAAFLGDVWDNFVEGFSNIMESLGEFIASFISSSQTFFDNIIGSAASFLSGLWNSFSSGFSNIMTSLGTFIGSFFSAIQTMFGNIAGAVSGFVTNFMNGVMGIVTWISSTFSSAWRGAWTGVTDIFRNVFDTLVTIAKTPINAVIGMINSLISGLNKIRITIPSWAPGGGKSFGVNIPKIPTLAKGGIVDSGQMFIAGEAGKEAILPLERNTGWIDEIAQKISKATTKQQPVTINFAGNGAAIARLLKPELDRETARVGGRMITGGAY